jgi:hypothetical protein
MKYDKLLWRVFIFTLAFILAKTFSNEWWMLFTLVAFISDDENGN